MLDVAHNTPALERLFETLPEWYPDRQLHVVFVLSSDKDLEGCLHAVLRRVPLDRVMLTQAQTSRASSNSNILNT